jgi:thiamine-phosphate pyrophosphorylase
MRGLYAIVDVQTLERNALSPLLFAEAVLSAGPCALQLRDKRAGARETLALLRALRPLATRAGVPLFANDRADLAALAACDGLHVGQDDLPPHAARPLLPAGARIGMSAHNAAELDIALSEDIDYVALGPVFGTRSKDNADPTLGLDGLAQLAARAAGRPRVAIGSIDLERAPSVALHVEAGAVIAALVDASARDPYAAAADRAAALHRALRGPATGGSG